jgi:hypothetical protein
LGGRTQWAAWSHVNSSSRHPRQNGSGDRVPKRPKRSRHRCHRSAKGPVGRTGKVDHIKVLSGDEAFVQDAKDYLKAAEFGTLPDIPQLANAKREWEFEVAFFTPKN